TIRDHGLAAHLLTLLLVDVQICGAQNCDQRVPRGNSRGTAAAGPPGMPQQNGRPRVIVAVPDVAECEVFAEWLASEGFEPVKISSPAGALNEMQVRPFDLLVADFRFAFQENLHGAARQRKRNPETPTVVVGDPDPGFATRSVGHR